MIMRGERSSVQSVLRGRIGDCPNVLSLGFPDDPLSLREGSHEAPIGAQAELSVRVRTMCERAECPRVPALDRAFATSTNRIANLQAFSRRSLTDSNRRPPPYQALLRGTGGSRRHQFRPARADFGATRFATDRHRSPPIVPAWLHRCSTPARHPHMCGRRDVNSDNVPGAPRLRCCLRRPCDAGGRSPRRIVGARHLRRSVRSARV
jgi:hypothetical protein